MEVTVELVGEWERTVAVTADPRPTYGELLERLEISTQRVVVLVGGRPVPEDAPIDADHIRVLRMITGGRG